jgi:TM2 domain-containing membrane protein YozV
MDMGKLYILLVFLFVSFAGSGEVKRIAFARHPGPLIHYSTPKPGLTIASDSTVHHRKHKLFAALLAFPILGAFGFHRMYLGTSAGVPFLYIATIGGCFGILPFVDFVLILLCKDVNTYAHNRRVFMWNKEK